MEKLDGDAAAKFINALIKSVQTLCQGYLEFDSGIEIIGHLNLSVDKGSSLHYILEEKVCKNEENSTLFISNSFHAQNQHSNTKGKDTETQSGGSRDEEKTSASDLSKAGKLSAISTNSSALSKLHDKNHSSISSALSKSHDKNRSGSTSSAKDSENVHSKPTSSTAKRKSSDDHSNNVRAAKSSHLSSSPSPVSHFLSSSSPVNTRLSLRQLLTDDPGGIVLPQTAAVISDNAGDLGVNLAGSVLERVDDQSHSDLRDSGEVSDGGLKVDFIKEEYVEGEQSACQFENSDGQQIGTHQTASSSDLSDGFVYPVSLHRSQSAISTFVPSAHDIAAAQHYGPSTSSGQPQPGTSGIRVRLKYYPKKAVHWRRKKVGLQAAKVIPQTLQVPPAQPAEVQPGPTRKEHNLVKRPKGRRRNCVAGHHRRVRTCWECPKCDVGLCPGCYVNFHKNLKE